VDEVEAVLFERPEPFHILDFEFAIWWHPRQSARHGHGFLLLVESDEPGA
jgi:hypothetical protein